MAVTLGDLEDRCHAFLRTHHRTMKRYFQSIGLRSGNPRLLFHLRRRPGITPKELAAVAGIATPTVTISVGRMEEAGLVRRERDAADGRVSHLYLTAAGEAMDAACARGRDFLIDSVYRGLSDEEQDVLYALLGRMIHNLDEAAATLPLEEE